MEKIPLQNTGDLDFFLYSFLLSQRIGNRREKYKKGLRSVIVYYGYDNDAND